MESSYYVIKRNGQKEEVQFDKVVRRIKNKSHNLSVNPLLIAQKVCSRIYDGVKTSELDELTAQICTSHATTHPDYGVLANRIVISNHHKITPATFKEAVEILHSNVDSVGNHNPLVSDKLLKLVQQYGEKLEAEIDYERDYWFDYFGFKTLQKGYLLKSGERIVERIQHMFMRVSLGLHDSNLQDAFNSYHALSKKYFTHATPTLFHSGTPRSQCLSCFLLGTDDSVSGMYKTIGDCAQISKWAGGIGVHATNIRSRGSYIRGSNGQSSGLIPLLRVYNAAARHIDQAGKRKGSIAIYLEPYHPDIMDFLDIRKNSGNEEARARDLFTALMVPDLFMKKVEQALRNPNERVDWCLFDPDTCEGLVDSYGQKFEQLYEKYEKNGQYREKVDVKDLWKKILSSQMETGTPYMVYKDRVNEHSNQKNIGTIRSSNLCSEILEYSDEKEYACCCLGSICLSEMVKMPDFGESVVMYSRSGCPYCDMAEQLLDKQGVKYEKIVLDDYETRQQFYNEVSGIVCEGESCRIENAKTRDGKRINTVPQIFVGDKHIGGYTELVEYMKPQFDYKKLEEVCEVVVRNLNKVIDVNYYPVQETARSNFRHRPLGVGVQGLSDLFFKMRLPFESEGAKQLNKQIFEVMQYSCIKASCKIAEERDTMIHSNHFRAAVQQFMEPFYIVAKSKNKNVEDIVDLDLERLEHRGEFFTMREVLNLPPMRSDVRYSGTYSTYKGSPLSEGIFQFESMGIKMEDTFLGQKWDELRQYIGRFGVRNSLLTALMPTASTSQIMGNNECFEPITSNLYTRRTLAGDFVVLNKYLVEDLIRKGLWNQEVKDMIIAANGSVLGLPFMSQQEKDLYKTVWEIKQKVIIDLSADRTPFVCQTQSLNLFFEEPKNSTLGSAHLYGWKRGLKTGSYYIRSRPKVQAQQFTIDPKYRKVINQSNYEVCESCSG